MACFYKTNQVIFIVFVVFLRRACIFFPEILNVGMLTVSLPTLNRL
jgi:hypothetical protein